MAKFLKEFETHSQYESYTADTQNFITPNVSVCKDQANVVHYNPYVPPAPVETRIVAKFNVTNTSSQTILAYIINNFSAIEIDGVVQPSVASAYTFSTTGEHTVKYTLIDSTSIGNGVFYTCNNITNIFIPDSVTVIGAESFSMCYSLEDVIMGSGVTSVAAYAFADCNNLTSITSNAITAPTIQNTSFSNVGTNGTLYVPQGSSGYNAWMGTGSYYLGKYNWTKVEQ